ncbi:histidine triad nucleotide-binding protein 3 [Plakobranchus ocellatus]|uniref:Adenosine 5'-monophosphoramidase HINT3 n=1 Tax=Plakobranchus ocellatus TaxID=259542 RepID=A0AAV4E2A0_9GAST|nr:histidine triad nucleotide-binding protein 3 [Plakobranchus ocellatus]
MATDTSHAENQPGKQKCVFCRIASHQEPGSRVLYEKDGLVIFRDIKPAAAHHYLVVPQKHVSDPKSLRKDDVELVERLVAAAAEFLDQQGGNVSEALLGFHWPPFNSISHLHLHVISPSRSMGWLASLIFRPNSFWFVTADWLLERLKSMDSQL